MALRAANTKSMDESTRLEKNRRIAQSQKETRERRKNKDILVRTVKIQRNKLSRAQLEALERVFIEGKWLYNTALAHGQFDEEFRSSLGNTVEVKLPTGEIERRQLTVLPWRTNAAGYPRAHERQPQRAEGSQGPRSKNRRSEVHLRNDLDSSQAVRRNP